MGVVSLTMGNSGFPLADTLRGDVKLFGQLFLRGGFFQPKLSDFISKLHDDSSRILPGKEECAPIGDVPSG